MKYLPNSVPPVFSSWPLFPTKGKNKSSIPFPKQAPLERLSHPGITTMATLAMPILLMLSIAQPAQAWEKQAKRSQQSDTGSLSSTLAVPIHSLVNHQIQPGDTLWELSQQYETSPEIIANYNGIESKQSLEVGDTLKIPLTETGNDKQPQLLERPWGGIGGAKPSEPLTFKVDKSASQESATPVISTVTEQGVTTSETQKQLPIKQFLADVEQLQANYEPEPVTDEKTKKENQRKVLSPGGSSSDEASPNSLATAPIKVEFYNQFLNPPIGETVSPELPPLSSPDQYLPNSPQEFDGYIWPAEGVFTSGYGRRWGRMHEGIDIAAPIGTPIVASAPGEVIVAGWNKGGYGKWVKLKHPDGSITLYAHNSKVLVHKGQTVNQGEPIAKMGNSGRSTGPHLHFEIQRPGKGAVNPIAYLPER